MKFRYNFATAVTCILVIACCVSSAGAQNGIDPRDGKPFTDQADFQSYINWINSLRNRELGFAIRGRDSISRAVLAQSAAIHNVERARLKYAQSRLLFAVAVDLELDNWLKRVNTYFDSRVANIEGKENVENAKDRARDGYWDRKRNAIRRKLRLMKEMPEYSGSAASGKGLNEFVNRFHGTLIGYGYPLDEIVPFKVDEEHWKLTPETLSQLQVRSMNAGMGSSTFSLASPTRVDPDLPYLLREGDLKVYADAYHSGRQQLIEISEQGRELTNSEINAFQKVLKEFSDAFERKYPPEVRRGMDTSIVYDFIECKRFFDKSAVSLRSIRSSRSAIPKGYDAEGGMNVKDLPSLVAYMTRTGLRFAKAKSPDHQGAYQRVYEKMVELHELTADPTFGNPEAGPTEGGVGFEIIDDAGDAGGIIAK